MTEPNVTLVPGTLDMLILKAVAGEAMHGFGVARWIERVTDQRLTIDEGALYPALHRLERRGWVESDWQLTENKRRAKYYALTKAGGAELTSQMAKWEGSTWAIQKVLGG